MAWDVPTVAPEQQRLVVEFDRQTLRWATQTWVPERFLQRLKAQGEAQGSRAPLGDSHGGWQKVAEVPTALALQMAPMHEWADRKAWRWLDDPQWRSFRADGGRRRYV